MNERIKTIYNYIAKSLKDWWNDWDRGEALQWLYKVVWYIAALAWLLWAIENPLWNWYKERVVVFVNISDSLANLLLVLYVVVIVASIAIHGIYKRHFRKEIWLFVILTAILYIRYRYCTNLFEFKKLSFIDTSITYVDVAVALYGLYVIVLLILEKIRVRLIAARFPKQEEFYFYDAPVSLNDNDVLRFGTSVQQIVDKIGTLTRDHSWSIGVVGPWGSGKTSFINFLSQHLSKDKYIVVTFNPRLAPRPSKIQELALNLLAEEIRPYNSGFRSLMHRYISALQLDGADGWLQVALSWLKYTSGIDDIKKELERELEKLPKQVFFVFDDFDRLTRDEIIEVLKLIDGNAKFKNIIYIAAYDHDQVGKLLGETSYIEKYFSIEIHVPLPVQDDVMNYMKEELEELIPTVVVSDKVALSGTNILVQNEALFKCAITTLRDAKRYLNILKTDLLTIKSASIDNEDFMLITLLKYRSMRDYESLCTNPLEILSLSGSHMVYGNVKEGENKEKDEVIINILTTLFSAQTRIAADKMFNRDRFYDYFAKPSDVLIAAQPSEIFNPSMDEMALHAKIAYLCSTDELQAEYFNYLKKFGVLYIDNKDALLRLVEVVLYTNRLVGERADVPMIWDILSGVFYTQINLRRKLGSTHKSTGAYIARFYDGKEKWTLGDLQVLNIVIPNLYRGGKAAKRYVLSKTMIAPVVKKKCLEMCDIYIESNDSLDFKILMEMFRLSIDSIDANTNKITIDKEVCDKLLSTIKKAPDDYISGFVGIVGESSSLDHNWVGGDPFWRQIFGSMTTFQKFLSEAKCESHPDIVRVRNFWKLFKANSYEAIEFDNQGNVQEIVNNNFEQQIWYLECLISINKKLDKIQYENNSEKRIEQIKGALNEILDVPLNIALKQSLINKCKSLI